MVFAALVMLCRFAVCPTRISPLSVKATIDGVVRPPSAFSMTFTFLPSTTATQEFVVPRSMPIALAMIALLSCSDSERSSTSAMPSRVFAHTCWGWTCAPEGRRDHSLNLPPFDFIFNESGGGSVRFEPTNGTSTAHDGHQFFMLFNRGSARHDPTTTNLTSTHPPT